jgi:hypothetical protein
MADRSIITGTTLFTFEEVTMEDKASGTEVEGLPGRSMSDLIELVEKLQDSSVKEPAEESPMSREVLLTRLLNKPLRLLVDRQNTPPDLEFQRWEANPSDGVVAFLFEVLKPLGLNPNHSLGDYYAIHNLIVQSKVGRDEKVIVADQAVQSLLIHTVFMCVPAVK